MRRGPLARSLGAAMLAAILATAGVLAGPLGFTRRGAGSSDPALYHRGGASHPAMYQGPVRPAADLERAYRANNRGVALLEQFNYQEAEPAFREALTIHPALAIARLNLALALLYAGRHADAVVEARQAAADMPDRPHPHYVLGLAAKADDRPEDARAAFRRALELDPDYAGTKVHLGQLHLQDRQYDEALGLFREAVTAEPFNVTAAYNLALALTRAGRTEEGRAAMQRFETLRDSAYGVTYGQTYLSQGKYAEAIASTGAEPDLVDAATPAVTFTDATEAMRPGAGAEDGGGPGAALLFDADGDGDLDLFDTGAHGGRFLRNERGVFTNDTARAGLALPSAPGWIGAVAGDYDNDGRPDLFVLGARAHRLLHQTASGAFEDATAASGLPVPAGPAASAAFADLDHDGDVDLVIAGAALQVFQNNGNGTFGDITGRTGLAGAGLQAIVASDFDSGRDIDLVAAGAAGPMLFRNIRDGSFRSAAADAGLATGDGGLTGALAAGDLNKDGQTDFFFGRSAAPGALALSDGQGRFRVTPAPDATRGATAAQLFDYDNDGLLDLLALAPSVRLLRNVGSGRWTDVTGPAKLPGGAGSPDDAPFRALALGDLDADGDTDAVFRLAGGALRFYRNDGGNRHASLRVRLAARVSNRSGVGAKVEMRAGSLRQMLETSAATPAASPADLVFGLGPRETADVVRVLWPSGILQAETSLPAAGAPAGGAREPLTITELDRKPSSCPYLFTWNGTGFEFVSDFMGGGEMGAWLAPALWNQPDPDEYVRIRADQLRPRNGRYELRLTNELEEALFFDRVQLVAVEHAAGGDVFPNEGLRSPPRPPFALTAVRGARPPVRAVDGHGHDVLARIAARDRRYPDDFALLPIRGYAEPHALVLDLGRVSDRPVLLLTGWTDYAFSNDNVAASQAGVAMQPPSLQVKDAGGRWRTVIGETGFPVGRPQTVVVDLAGTFLSSSREVRILTNMRIYWDEILVSEPDRGARPVLKRLEALAADLRWRGLSAEQTPDGREPYGYDYGQVSTRVPWKVMVGRYTREGDVRELLRGVDDMFVISRPGDEIALSFAALPPVPPGRARTFLLYTHGYSKEMNPRSAVPDAVGPLPFRAMSGYPYPATEHYPRTERHRSYQQRYNTRVVARPWPSIDAALHEQPVRGAEPAPTPPGAGR